VFDKAFPSGRIVDGLDSSARRRFQQVMRTVTREESLALDAADPLAHKRKAFVLPQGKIYLDGNSLGCLPAHAAGRIARAVSEEWGQSLITSWNRHGWIDLAQRTGDRIARLVGAEQASVLVGDTISVNLFKLMSAALELRPDRRTVVSDTGNFPSDLYIAEGVIRQVDKSHVLRLTAPDEALNAIDDETALVSVTHVDYRTARTHDIAAIVEKAHAHGALVLVDLSHTTGALPIDLTGLNVDFAVGCTYKYLNGGPGAPGFLYVRPDLQEKIQSPLSGWLGHAAPFAFEQSYRPAPGILRQQCGTPPVLSLIALDAALDVFDDVVMKAVQTKAHALCSQFVAHVESFGVAHGLKLAGPRAMSERGSHVSFHAPNGYAIMQALIARGVIGDFRAPDMIRFGFTPLYTSFTETFDAAQILRDILETEAWNRPEFLARKAVT
jgi:kynureninase